MRDRFPFRSFCSHCCFDSTIRTAPPKYEQVALFITLDFQGWDIGHNALYFFGAETNHMVVIRRVITYVTCNVLFLESTNSMLESFRSR